MKDEQTKESTTIKNIIVEDNEEEEFEFDDTSYTSYLFDFSLPQSIRLKALNYCYRDDPDKINEIVSKFVSIYNITNLSTVEKFLYDYIAHSTLPIDLRLDCALTLTHNQRSKNNAFRLIRDLCEQFDNTLPPTQELNTILHLFKSEYKEEASSYLTILLENQSIPIDFRYKALLHLPEDIRLENFVRFYHNKENDIRYRLLSCQYLLSQKTTSDTIGKVEEYLLECCKDESLGNNTRADAADIILSLGTTESVRIAEEAIVSLGGKALHIFDNAQNVHTTEIEESVRDTIQSLEAFKFDPMPSFDTVRYHIEKLTRMYYKNEEERNKIMNALTRIELDRVVFRTINHSLSSVLRLIYTYIQQRIDFKEELEIRLLEELLDMSGTCSSGYVSRLVNTLSGYGNHSLSISWEDQIKANLAGRLNARMRVAPNRDELIDQISVDDIKKKSAFLDFFRKHISFIKEEMYLEFRDYITDADWDLYFQRAIVLYYN